jgi:hypothetical protein
VAYIISNQSKRFDLILKDLNCLNTSWNIFDSKFTDFFVYFNSRKCINKQSSATSHVIFYGRRKIVSGILNITQSTKNQARPVTTKESILVQNTIRKFCVALVLPENAVVAKAHHLATIFIVTPLRPPT